MNYKQKNTNLPMVVVDKPNHIRHGGWYGYHYNDMDVSDRAISSHFFAAHWRDIYPIDHRLDSLHGPANGNGDIACLRRELWRERIKCMFGVIAVHDKKFKFLLEALAPAA